MQNLKTTVIRAFQSIKVKRVPVSLRLPSKNLYSTNECLEQVYPLLIEIPVCEFKFSEQ